MTSECWPELPLAKLVTNIRSGFSVTRGDTPAADDERGVLTLSAVSGCRLNLHANKVVPSKQHGQLVCPVSANTVLMSRSNTADLVGECAFVATDAPNLFLPDLLWELRLDPSICHPEFFALAMSSPLGRSRVRRTASGTSGSMKKISMQGIRRIKIPIPPIRTQNQLIRIGRVHEQYSNAIERQIRVVRRRFRGLVQQLLSCRRRLPAFTGRPWREVRLRNVTRESTKRNGKTLGVDRVMAVNKTHGLIPMRERTIADDLNRYKVVSPGAFAYNPMRLNIGSIARSHFEHDVLVSPDYVVFECTECEPRYLDVLRRSGLWRRHMGIAGNGSVRVRIYYDDLASMKVTMPGLTEQRAIAEVLDTAQKEIDLLRQLRDQIQKQKRGLMQGLLTGHIRVPAAKET